MKKISVCIATYNGEKFIYNQIQSILEQLSEKDEIIISDNYSSDETLRIINSIADPRIKIVLSRKISLIKNFENALINSSGDYIFLADQDDVWLPKKIKIMVEKLESYDLVISDCILVNEKLQIIINSFYSFNKSRPGFIQNVIKNSYIGCCMAFNRKILNASLPFPEKIPMHDWWIGLIGSLFGKVIFLDDKLILYRRHSASASITGNKSNYSFIMKLEWRINLVKEITLRYIKIKKKCFLKTHS